MKGDQNKTYAQWSIELYTDCPHCGEWIDLAQDPEFWSNNEGLQPGEHNTEKSNSVNAYCPECHRDFTVECEY